MRKKVKFTKFEKFDLKSKDGRLCNPNFTTIRDARGAIELRQKLGRPLTNREIQKFI